MSRQRSIFRYSLLRIVAAMLIFELLVGGLAFTLLMLPVLENHAKNFAEQIINTHAGGFANVTIQAESPVDDGQSFLPFNLLLARDLQQLSGQPTAVRKVAKQPNHYWLPLHTTKSSYLIFDHRAVVGTMPIEALVSWFTLALIGGLVIAIWLASGLSRPITLLRNSIRNHTDSTPHDSAPTVGIIELNDLRLEFAKLTDNLALAIDDRTTLLLGLSHELSAPVARLTMAFELYAKQIDSARRDDMQTDLDEMRRIIEQFLSAARCLSPQDQQQYSLTHLMTWLEQRYTEKPNIHIEIPLQESSYTINAIALERILVNLIDNALRHGLNSTITASVIQHPENLEFIVADNGPGIPDTDIPRLFHPFEKRAASQGVGLGLALSRLMAEQNGWNLQLKNRVAGGLQATILIPIISPSIYPSGNSSLNNSPD